jgi:predicted Rossmann fold nucleotide-binding protein DprA/Smf involved in DNA uptake
MRLPEELPAAIDTGRLLLLSPFDSKHRRATLESAQRRNEIVAAIADEIFIAYATPGGKTEQFCRTMVTWGKPVLTLGGEENARLMALGANCICSR